MSDAINQCPCESGKPYRTCCEPFHQGELPPTAEQLMRSRYTAFALGNPSYLLDSWHPRTRPERIELDPAQKWLGLKVIETVAGGPGDPTGTVRFVARYKLGGRGYRLEEHSRFERVNGAWTYMDGEIS